MIWEREVYTYDVSDDGVIRNCSLQNKGGIGPRHIVFAHHGSKAYLAGELAVQWKS